MSIRLFSWNVNGIRAILKKDFNLWIQKVQPDILCLQETKATENQVTEALPSEIYKGYWSSAERKGYSGVATFSKIQPLSTQKGFGIDKFDQEGRVMITEFPSFILYNVYFPNGQQSPERLAYKLEFYERFIEHLQETRKRQPHLIICGDYNIAHQEIDLTYPKENSQYSGFLPEERAILDKMIALGYVDTFRYFHPDPHQYTWWSYRSQARKKNIGWRIDYFFTTQELTQHIKRAEIHADIEGSDHCPISLEISVGASS